MLDCKAEQREQGQERVTSHSPAGSHCQPPRVDDARYPPRHKTSQPRPAPPYVPSPLEHTLHESHDYIYPSRSTSDTPKLQHAIMKGLFGGSKTSGSEDPEIRQLEKMIAKEAKSEQKALDHALKDLSKLDKSHEKAIKVYFCSLRSLCSPSVTTFM